MPRYFFGENAGRPIRVGSRQYTFQILSTMGGTQQGVISVPDDEVESFLSVAARWVVEITGTEYDECLQKKKQDRRSLPSPDLGQQAPQGPALKGRGAVVVDGAAVSRPVDKDVPTKIDDAVDLGRGDDVVSDVPTAKIPASRRQNHRQKRGNE